MEEEKTPVFEEVSLVLLEAGDRFLFLKLPHDGDAHGKWTIPGGRMTSGDNDSTPIRERVWEQTGIVTMEMEKLGEFTEGKYHVHLYYTSLVRDPKCISMKHSNEYTAFAFLTRKEIESHFSNIMPLRLSDNVNPKPVCIDDYTRAVQNAIRNFLPRAHTIKAKLTA